MASDYIKKFLSMNMNNCKIQLDTKLDYTQDPSCQNLKQLFSFLALGNDKIKIYNYLCETFDTKNIIHGRIIAYNKKSGEKYALTAYYILETQDDVSYFKKQPGYDNY
ncbi:hypothetical protein Hokovirus_4_63 [Hokovirus HKV1]|uniref:Uncharacterized protein n=1 Tax=Hokovirus HKV1 TaxID=1977638 RepID=A0A1V0SH88_9VIRU|nr:hypothetical protein Hokovirus_4_63 [Hokovirus HKV1]